MIVYNFVAEHAALVIIVAILLSFSRDYDANTLRYRFLKVTYQICFLTTMTTIAALVSGVPGTGALHTTVAYFCNALYFALLPSISLCFLLYAVLETTAKFDKSLTVRKFLPPTVPYIIYLVVLAIGLATNQVFSITEAEGYVRGPWFRLPYLIIIVNLIIIVAFVLRNSKRLHRDIMQVFISSAALCSLLLYIQFRDPNIIMTGTINTACILGLHLYALNVKKSSDHLTGLSNRMALIHHIEGHIKQSDHCSLYVFSLRNMKTINNRYGIDFGDKVLLRTAHIFIGHAMDQRTFRYSGDEFALLLDHRVKNYDALVSAIVADLDTPHNIGGNEIRTDFVYARVDYDLFGKSAQELISALDYSIHDLKENPSSDRFLYDTSVVQALIKRTNMIQQIKDAMDSNLFEVHYQPIYCVQTGTFTQAEALVRMRNVDGYLVYPGDFIDLAVKTGLIVPITYQILDQVCADLRHFLDHHSDTFPLQAISVNFPYLQFGDQNMPQKVMAILDKYHISPSMIKIEITEREMVADTRATKKIMLQMEALGFGFELDDFGMDYSNMSVVLGLPLEAIKLDRSFLLAAFTAEGNKHFFRHLAAGIASIGATIICEGIEEQEQLDFVTACGCQYAQGYFFSKPLDRASLQAFFSDKMLRVDSETASFSH